MKAILVNGSPRASGNTSLALKEIEGVLVEEGFEVTSIQVGHLPIRGCLACGKCHELGRCVIDDAVNRDAALFREADAVVFASPVYYAMANGTLVSYLQRLFYSSHIDWRYKVGAAVAVARRGGLSSTFDELNKFFSITGMTVAGGQYWNGVHGRAAGEAKEDTEGLQQMRTLARHIAFLVKATALEKAKEGGLPSDEKPVYTNFVR